MAVWWGVALGALVIVVIAGGLMARRMLERRKPPPEELERRRRGAIQQTGKLGNGEIIDVEGASIIYSYRVAGVVYTASQDTTGLQTVLPADPHAMIGPVAIKFHPRNPANSIVVCEEWSGLRHPWRPGP
jgi:hypothetical protein